MNEMTVNEQYQAICHLIKQKRLKEALIQLESYLWQCNKYDLKTRLEQLQTSYHYMLQYMKVGVNDPGRKKLHEKLLIDTLEVTDQTKLAILDDISTEYYHRCRRKYIAESSFVPTNKLQLRIESLLDDLAVSELISKEKKIEMIRQYEDTLKKLFIQNYCSSIWSVEDEIDAKNLLESDLIPTNALSLFTSAIMLSLMKSFDIKKLLWLFDAYQSSNVHVSQRALVAIAFIFHFNSERISLYPQIKEIIDSLNEKTNLATDLLRVYKQLLLAQETEKIDKKMREEIIPEMIKNASSMKDLKLGFEESDEEKDGINPDWQNMFDDTPLGDRLKEMSELQLEGADVQMSTFASLKGFPFFKELHHWFYPFDKQQLDIVLAMDSETQENKMFNLILESGIFCNSDKYSLFFIMQQFPQSQRDMVFSQLTEQQLDEFMNDEKTKTFKSLTEQPHFISNQYIHDLYRFFKLNVYRHEFRNIFNEKLELHKVPFFKSLLYNEQSLAALVDFHLKKEHWLQTAELCQDIIDLNGSLSTQAELYQKLGFALQKTKQLDKAILAYLKADTILPDHIWTLRHLATCYRLNKAHEQALEYYQKVEQITPDNLNIIYFIGSCLVELGRYDEALKYFFKLDYMDSGSLKAMRGVAWCSFILDKYEQAQKYYQKIIDLKPIAIDYLNAGHVAWCANDIKEAAALYEKAAGLFDNRDTFVDMFYKDKEYLLAKNIDEDDISLMIDLL